MKKNLYRTVSIKKVDEEKLLRSLDGGKRIVVGVDVAKTDFVAGLAKEDGEIDLTDEGVRRTAQENETETRHRF